jgi:hypothetical protein
VETPKEVCTRSRRNPRRVNRPIIKKWCYTPEPEHEHEHEQEHKHEHEHEHEHDESADINNPLFGAIADLGDNLETAAEEGEKGSGNDGGENEGRTFRG